MTDERAGFSHLDDSGGVTMVDVGAKSATRRIAVARCRVLLSPETLALLAQKALPKGDVLTTAKVAGILAAKQTAALIPMCHSIALDYADVRFRVTEKGVDIEAEARTVHGTGVEMEALTAVQAAALTMYDMCKAVQKDIVITDCRLVRKTGGKSGDYLAPGE